MQLNKIVHLKYKEKLYLIDYLRSRISEAAVCRLDYKRRSGAQFFFYVGCLGVAEMLQEDPRFGNCFTVFQLAW